MALVLVKEDGTGKPDANTYADVADGNAYFEGHVWNAAWELNADDRKAMALVMATRLVDAEFIFNGYKTYNAQALQWPRVHCPDPDRAPWVFSILFQGSNYVESNAVPPAVISATLEMARELMIVDRTAAYPGEGLYKQTSGAGASFTSTTFNKVDTRKVLTQVARAMLSKFGSPVERSGGAVRVQRV